MAETHINERGRTPFKWDKAWVAVAIILALVAALDPGNLWPAIRFTFDALLSTAPFILFAVLAVAYLKATGAESLLAAAFDGRETRMIFMAAALGGLSPFCDWAWSTWSTTGPRRHGSTPCGRCPGAASTSPTTLSAATPSTRCGAAWRGTVACS